MPVSPKRLRLHLMELVLACAAAVFVLAVAGAAVARHQQPRNGSMALPPVPAVADEQPRFATRGPHVGFALELHHTDHFHLYMEAVDRMAAGGADSLLVVTPAWQEHGASNEITIEARLRRGPTREQLVRLLNHAHKRELKTALMPIVLMTEPRGNEWRGRIHPPDWSAWWQSYRTMIGWFANVAAQTEVDLFYVGSELLSTESQTRRWSALIEHVERIYPGSIGYTTNWDHYSRTTLWPMVDVVGINGYWDITTGTSAAAPDPAILSHNWGRIRNDLLRFARQVDRPVVLTEVGYPSLPWALQEPWNYVTDVQTEATPQIQAMGYAAFLSGFGVALQQPPSLDDGRPALAGVFFYRWDVYHHGGPTDTGYGIRGKPAEDLLHQWMQDR